jgi:uncharacterized protein (DUF924 family)
MDKWFMKSSNYDDEIKERFGSNLVQAEANGLQSWLGTPKEYVAAVVLLDQFSRHVYRNEGNPYKNDDAARNISSQGFACHYNSLNKFEKLFVLMPFVHSESLSDQERAVSFMRQEYRQSDQNKFWGNALGHAIAHREVIQEFGRFPKRNQRLGRMSTSEEVKYIQEHAERAY